jgi:hypothetical protein
MIPLLSGEQLRNIPSRAEARFYEACKDQLPAEVVVIYSSSWIYRKKNEDKVHEGEADFTLLFPGSGILAVEVKGGGVAIDSNTGKWFSIDRNHQRNHIKNPFKQASDERHALLDQISGHVAWRRWPGKRLTIGHAVVLPDLQDATPLVGPDRKKEFIGVGPDLQNLNNWVQRVVKFWHQEGETELGFLGVQIVKDILCKSIDVMPALKSLVDDVEQQRIKLTANQAKVFRTIGGRRRAIVSGGAGTGKTLLAAHRARALAESGLEVLLVCYNRPLADSLFNAMNGVKGLSVMGYHQWCETMIRRAKAQGVDVLKEAQEAYPSDSEQKLFELQYPFALALAAEVLTQRYDAILVDEAQDFGDEYWMGLESFLRSSEESYLYIFLDENQRLYERSSSMPILESPFYLTNNCRNTAPIHELAYQYYSGEEIDVPDLQGPDISWLDAVTATDQASAIVARVVHWVGRDGLRPSDITILLAKNSKNYAFDLLTDAAKNSSIYFVNADHSSTGGVLVDTVARFKGLETHAAVLWVGDEVVDDEKKETMYVGVTRAKSLLAIVGSNRALKKLRAFSKN